MTLYIETAVRLALSQVGARYVYGAKEPASDPNPKGHGGAFDCSGLMTWAADRAGGYLPDGSQAQLDYCRAHGTLADIATAERTRGALLFLGPDGDEHVVMGLGNGLTIEARGAAYGVGEWSVYRDAWTAAARIPGFTYGQAPAPPLPTGSAQVSALQHAWHVNADGLWGPATDAAGQAVRANRHDRAEQTACGTNPDGIWGPASQAAYYATVRATQNALHVAADGVWGPTTDRAFLVARANHYRP